MDHTSGFPHYISSLYRFEGLVNVCSYSITLYHFSLTPLETKDMIVNGHFLIMQFVTDETFTCCYFLLLGIPSPFYHRDQVSNVSVQCW